MPHAFAISLEMLSAFVSTVGPPFSFDVSIAAPVVIVSEAGALPSAPVGEFAFLLRPGESQPAAKTTIERTARVWRLLMMQHLSSAPSGRPNFRVCANAFAHGRDRFHRADRQPR